MGQVTFTSQPELIHKPVEEVYDFLADLNHFEVMMPDQVVQWESTADTCAFTIKNLAKIELKIKERIPVSKILVESTGDTPLDLELAALIEDKSGNSQVTLELDVDLSPMLKMMASGPLQNLVNIMNSKLKAYLD
jgi:carbon monoxide dehydrogenase subunit G